MIIRDLVKLIKSGLKPRNRICPDFFNIPTHMTREELLRLYDLAVLCPDESVIVELGSYLGASTCFLSAGVRSKGGKVYAVDTWENTAMSEGPRDTFAEFSKNTESQKEHIIVLRGVSIDMAKRFGMKVNLLFIDGDHSYEGCFLDWNSWSKHLDEGAIVVFHDYGWAEGVQRVVNEFVRPLAKKEIILSNMYVAFITREKITD